MWRKIGFFSLDFSLLTWIQYDMLNPSFKKFPFIGDFPQSFKTWIVRWGKQRESSFHNASLDEIQHEKQHRFLSDSIKYFLLFNKASAWTSVQIRIHLQRPTKIIYFAFKFSLEERNAYVFRSKLNRFSQKILTKIVTVIKPLCNSYLRRFWTILSQGFRVNVIYWKLKLT